MSIELIISKFPNTLDYDGENIEISDIIGLTKSLRIQENRDNEKIKVIIEKVFKSMINKYYNLTTEYKIEIFKLFSNFIADSPDNLDIFLPNINKILLIEDEHLEILNIQLIFLLNLIIVSETKLIEKYANDFIKKIFKLKKFNELIEIHKINLVEVMEELFKLEDAKLSVENFGKVYSKLKDNDEAKDFLILTSNSILNDEMARVENEELFKTLLNNCKNLKDCQILLNFSYNTETPNENSINLLIETLDKSMEEDDNETTIISTLLIVLSNYIVNKERKFEIVKTISVEKLLNIYFTKKIYLKICLNCVPFELQGINFFNKLINVINKKFKVNHLEVYFEGVNNLIGNGFYKFQLSIFLLNLKFLYKLVNSIDKFGETDIEVLKIFEFSKGIDVKEDEINKLVEMILFELISIIIIKGDKISIQEEIIEFTFKDRKLIRGKIDIEYLIELSKVLGILSKKYSKKEWFIDNFNELSKIKNQNGNQDGNRENTGVKILENNCLFIKSMINCL